MGRNFEFNREETLNKAMHLFWKKGYKATSMKDLVDEMGIQPGSIYNSYGDKHTLFLEAVKNYGDVVTSNALRTLEGKGSPVENLHKFFNEIISLPQDKKARGCLVINSVVELSPHDDETAKIVKSILKNIEKAFYNCLKRAQESGEINSDKDIKALSKYYASSTNGLLVTAKSNASKKEMQEIVRIVLESLK